MTAEVDNLALDAQDPLEYVFEAGAKCGGPYPPWPPAPVQIALYSQWHQGTAPPPLQLCLPCSEVRVRRGRGGPRGASDSLSRSSGSGYQELP